jgi:hypothetical protein
LLDASARLPAVRPYPLCTSPKASCHSPQVVDAVTLSVLSARVPPRSRVPCLGRPPSLGSLEINPTPCPDNAPRAKHAQHRVYTPFVWTSDLPHDAALEMRPEKASRLRPCGKATRSIHHSPFDITEFPVYEGRGCSRFRCFFRSRLPKYCGVTACFNFANFLGTCDGQKSQMLDRQPSNSNSKLSSWIPNSPKGGRRDLRCFFLRHSISSICVAYPLEHKPGFCASCPGFVAGLPTWLLSSCTLQP